MRSTRVLGFLLGTILLLVGISPVDAQVPSAQQLEMLRSLSPAAREQLLNQIADGSDATASDEEGSSRPELAEGEPTSKSPMGSLMRKQGHRCKRHEVRTASCRRAVWLLGSSIDPSPSIW
jgi:hypothetical protein